VVLVDLPGKGHERKEAFLLKAVLVTFVATKVTRPSGHELKGYQFNNKFISGILSPNKIYLHHKPHIIINGL
jgi:hypothetical protein